MKRKVILLLFTYMLTAPALVCERSRNDDKLLLGCENGSLVMLPSNRPCIDHMTSISVIV